MSKYQLIAVIFSTAVGIAIGIFIANWRFTDADVVLGARLLFGVAGAVVGGFGSKWLLQKRTPQY